MSDPAEEFRKLAEAVGQMRQEVATALDRAAPDYRRDLAQLFTALNAIEQKPVLSASAGALDAAARAGAEKGVSDAASALRRAQRAFDEAQRRVDDHVSVLNRLSWQTALVATVVLLALGTVTGVSLGVYLFPTSLMSTKAGCTLGGGLFVPAQGQNPDACVYWGSRPT